CRGWSILDISPIDHVHRPQRPSVRSRRRAVDASLAGATDGRTAVRVGLAECQLCPRILDAESAEDLLEESLSVTQNILFPLMWFIIVPFYVARYFYF